MHSSLANRIPMTKSNFGFSCILAAQFFSAMADNALLFAAIALLNTLAAPTWQVPALQQCFALAAIVLAPFVGPFADALPKGRVMFISNSLKIFGCVQMLLGLHPLLAYGCVGIGSAMYTPAKYGILSEYFPPEKLVWANGWMEGLTVAAIILGAIVGGIVTGDGMERLVLAHLANQPGMAGVDTVPEVAIAVVLAIYGLGLWANLYIPKLPIDHKMPRRTPCFLVKDFRRSFEQLWTDRLGQVSLAVTTLFWGAGTTLRLVILSWGVAALGLKLEQATQLTAVVAIGIGVGAAAAGKNVPVTHAVRVLKVGVFMGATVAATVLVDDWRLAMPLLLAIGAMGGYFLIPMNALLQHRGHRLMGAGHSIAVQNFNENLGILLMLGAYALMLQAALSVHIIAIVLGVFLAAMTAWLMRVHGHDQDHGED